MPQVWLPFVQDDAPIILDLSDIAKPLAKKMDYLATVRDGSTGKLVNGYWLVELYASLSRKNPVLVLLEPFSHEEPYSPGQNPVVLAAVHKIFKLTDKRSVLVVDRGFDGWVMFEDWLDNKYRFVARLVGERHLLCFFGGSEQSEVGQRVPDKPDFLLYRLLGGLTEAINTCFWLYKDLLRKSFRKPLSLSLNKLHYPTNIGIIMVNKLNCVIEPGVTGKYWIGYIN